MACSKDQNCLEENPTLEQKFVTFLTSENNRDCKSGQIKTAEVRELFKVTV